MTIESEAYAKHKNLKLAANEMGIKWQTLYCRLKKQGIEVTGDKSRYGSARDKLAAISEDMFCQIVPEAINMNKKEWQSKFDILVNNLKIDVKCSLPRMLNVKKSNRLSWSFSFKKQSLECDFIVCFCLDEQKNLKNILVIPKEFCEGLQTVSVPIDGDSKWKDYIVDKYDLREFLISL